MSLIPARPYEFMLDPPRAALLIIDMQRDFVEPGGFGDALGNDVSQLRGSIEPLAKLLAAARASGLFVMHTREGHRPDLSDLHETKRTRGRGAKTIGDEGPMCDGCWRGRQGELVAVAEQRHQANAGIMGGGLLVLGILGGLAVGSSSRS